MWGKLGCRTAYTTDFHGVCQRYKQRRCATFWTKHILGTTGWQQSNHEWGVTMPMPAVWFEGETPLVCFWASLSMWSQKWWGFLRFLHLWPQGHCSPKCTGFRQLIQCPCSLKMAIICPCGNDLNFLQVYKKCLPILQATLVSAMFIWYDSFMDGFSLEELSDVLNWHHIWCSQKRALRGPDYLAGLCNEEPLENPGFATGIQTL